MENLGKLFISSMAAFMFVLAISILFITNRELNKAITLVKKDVQKSQVIYHTDEIYANDKAVKYHELIGVLMHQLECDIKVNSKEIKKEEHNFLEFDFATVIKSDYTKSYIYDEYGDIKKIVYSRK